MSQAHMGDRVKVHYVGTLADGSVFDETEQGVPLEFTMGGQEVVPGFEEALVGMQPDETRTVTIPAEEAYGPRRDEMVAHVERERFPGNPAFRIGQQLQITQKDGQKLVARVTGVTPTTVTIDANHPLAGQDLTYRITLVSIMGDACLL
jgi:peptidylprolyl isomerase